MADVTVKQLAQIVGISIERLLNQLQEAGLSFIDENQAVNEEQKRTLLNHLKTAQLTTTNKTQTTFDVSERITLKRKSVTKVTVGHESKTVNVEVRKRRTYIKRNITPTVDNVNEIAATVNANSSMETEIIDNVNIEIDPVLSADLISSVVVENNTLAIFDEVTAAVISTVETVAGASIAEKTDKISGKVVADASRQARGGEPDSEENKTNKRRHGKDDLAFNDAFRKNKQKNKYILADLNNEDEIIQMHHKRHKTKKNKDDKSDKYREAEESMTHAFALPVTPAVHEVMLSETITVAELAKRMSIKVADLIKTMMKLGAIVTINQVIDQSTAIIVVEELGHIPRILNEDAIEHTLGKLVNKGSLLQGRAPVVTIMGHVDHGKTSLLDYIRRTKVAFGEAGGITQHIGAYHVHTDKGDITFLDTPGHAAFTAMRARGAQATDIVVLIVAADDGVKPQTIEAIQHAKAAKVPLIVAINKMDKHDANPEQVINELSAHEVISEAWGGETLFVNISAKTGLGIDALLDAILLQADVLELQALVDGAAHGIVIESRLDKGRGPVATILVQSGTLHKGDILLAGFQYGRVRNLINDAGIVVTSAGPSMPVEVIGLSAIPHAGDVAIVVPDEKKAREVALFRQGKFRDVKFARKQKTSLEGIIENMITSGDLKVLNVVLKADVQGSIEAITDALIKLSNDEVKVEIIASGVGGITASDVHLALASHAFLIGFNVRADSSGKRLAEQESVSIYYYSVIYEIVDQIKSSLFGMLAPQFKEEIVGVAEVRDVFRSPKLGAIAGCMVTEGIVKRNNPIRVLRNNIVIYEGTLESLRRFKDDAGEVRQGLECGIGVKNYNDVKPGDLIEVFETIEIVRHL